MVGACYNWAGGDTITAAGKDLLGAKLQEKPDATLVARTKEGDVEAFAELVARHQASVYSVVSRMISSRDDTEDIVQEIFVRAFKSIGCFKQDSSFGTWIYRIAVNTAIKHMRGSKIRSAASIDDPDSGLSDTLTDGESDRPGDAAEKAERSEAVRRAVQMLPEHHRAVVVLHYFENLSCAEIAEIMDCSVGTVWSRLHYACKKLKGELSWLNSEC
ncbi:MAG: sigma-70 family RNA polymerase sigma factor [Armatimonadota bacterium]|nr:sigma-70 family RNA polymerase sigma factor [Armatimonadota bacterium]